MKELRKDITDEQKIPHWLCSNTSTLKNLFLLFYLSNLLIASLSIIDTKSTRKNLSNIMSSLQVISHPRQLNDTQE